MNRQEIIERLSADEDRCKYCNSSTVYGGHIYCSAGHSHDMDCDGNDFNLDYKIEEVISALEQQLTNGWISVSERLPEEYKRVDGNDCYSISNEVICGAYNEVEQIYETWIDYTIDGEWQTHEYYEDEILAWQPLPEPYKEVSE